MPNMDQLLHAMVGSSTFSLLDDFLSYKQIMVNEEDGHKIIFSTP